MCSIVNFPLQCEQREHADCTQTSKKADVGEGSTTLFDLAFFNCFGMIPAVRHAKLPSSFPLIRVTRSKTAKENVSELVAIIM